MAEKLTKDERDGLELWAEKTGAVAEAMLNKNPPKEIQDSAHELCMVADLIIKLIRRNDYLEPLNIVREARRDGVIL